MVTKAVFIDYSWKRKKIGLTKCKDVSWCLLCPWGMVSRGIQQLRKGGFVGSMCSIQSYFVLASHSVYSHSTVTLLPLYSHFAPTLQSLCPLSTSDPTEKGNGNRALYLIIYSLLRRISASIAKTIVLTILRFLDFAFAR